MKCTATQEIEDECAICTFQCELEAGHDGDHLTTYPGQWGEVAVPVSWSAATAPVLFHRNSQVRRGEKHV